MRNNNNNNNSNPGDVLFYLLEFPIDLGGHLLCLLPWFSLFSDWKTCEKNAFLNKNEKQKEYETFLLGSLTYNKYSIKK
jgi:hypothetical protein